MGCDTCVTGRGLVLGALLSLATGCPPPAEASLGGVHAVVEDTTLTVRRDVALTVDLASAGFRSADATYDNQFGMFDILERPDGEFAYPDAAAVTAVTSTNLDIALADGDAPHGQVTITSAGHQHVVLTATSDDADHNRATLSLDCSFKHLAGFGAQSHDVDHMGQRVPLWVSEQGIGKVDTDELPDLWQIVGRRHTTHIPIPAGVTEQGIGFVLETTAYSVFDVCATDPDRLTVESWDGQIKLHVFFGQDPLDALRMLTDFVGRPALPAPWMLAPWNDQIFGSDAVLEFAQFLRDEGIASSAIWSEDWKGGEDVGDNYRLEPDWNFQDDLYTDYEGLTADLRDLGIMHQLYFNTFVVETADIFDEALAEQYVVLDDDGGPWLFAGPDAGFSDTALVDLTNPDAVDWVKGYLHMLLERGARGWMADYGEWMPVTRAQLHSGDDPALWHNRYPVEWQRINQEVVDEAGLRDEVVIYARSGHLFSQAVTQVVWAGDQRTSFDVDDGLPTVIPIGLGLGASGYLFFAHDIAGYQSNTNPPATKELFYRWTEFGAFSPVMRTHHGTHARFNHNLRSDEETTALWKRYANLHTRLYPYLRAEAVRAAQGGVGLMLPLGVHFPDDDAVWPRLDEYMLGPALLVAPVIEDGARQRDVTLPAGRWAGLLTGEVLEGPGTFTVDAPLEEIPVFVRAGGIVPLTANQPLTLLPGVDGIDGLESTEGDRVVYVGLGASGHFVEESGASYHLRGDGTGLGGLEVDAEGAVTLDGNDEIEGDGFAFEVRGHDPARGFRIFFR